jgi:hypothetical protein
LHVLGAAAEFERALIRERTHAGRARYKAGFRERQGGQDCLQPVWAEPATPPSQESVRPGRGTPVAAPRMVTSPNCEVSGLRTRTVVRTLQPCSKSSYWAFGGRRPGVIASEWRVAPSQRQRESKDATPRL